MNLAEFTANPFISADMILLDIIGGMIAEMESARFVLRSLSEQDAGESYLGWLSDASTARFITTAAVTKSLSDLKLYVREQCDQADIFLGIFERVSGHHIGNIKYEPIDFHNQ